MKKRVILLSSLVLTLGAAAYLALAPKSASAIDDSTTSSQSGNQTIEIYKEKFAGKSEEEVNDFFDADDDNKIIIADKSGGYTSSLTNDYDEPVETISEDGTKTVQSFHDKSVAATIGEVKQALKEEREKN